MIIMIIIIIIISVIIIIIIIIIIVLCLLCVVVCVLLLLLLVVVVVVVHWDVKEERQLRQQHEMSHIICSAWMPLLVSDASERWSMGGLEHAGRQDECKKDAVVHLLLEISDASETERKGQAMTLPAVLTGWRNTVGSLIDIFWLEKTRCSGSKKPIAGQSSLGRAWKTEGCGFIELKIPDSTLSTALRQPLVSGGGRGGRGYILTYNVRYMIKLMIWYICIVWWLISLWCYSGGGRGGRGGFSALQERPLQVGAHRFGAARRPRQVQAFEWLRSITSVTTITSITTTITDVAICITTIITCNNGRGWGIIELKYLLKRRLLKWKYNPHAKHQRPESGSQNQAPDSSR